MSETFEIWSYHGLVLDMTLRLLFWLFVIPVLTLVFSCIKKH